MYKIKKRDGKTVEAYRLGDDSPTLCALIDRGKLVKTSGHRWEVFSQEAVRGGSGHGQTAQDGDYIKIDSQGYPYPNTKAWFEKSHRPTGPDLYEQIPQPLDAWDASEPPCAEIDFLCREKGLVLNDADPEHYFTAPLWGTMESADRNAVLVFYSITRAADGIITDADYNLVARDEFEKTYTVLAAPGQV